LIDILIIAAQDGPAFAFPGPFNVLFRDVFGLVQRRTPRLTLISFPRDAGLGAGDGR
jgi:hypothetical protein